MTDEIENKNEGEKEYSPIEKLALELEWDPKGKKDAESFLKDGYKMRNEKITDLYKISKDLKDMMSKQEKSIYEKAQAEFRQQRDEAIERGDLNRVREIEKQTKEMNEQNDINRAANEFIKRNADWYNGSSHEHLKMRKIAVEADKLVGGDTPDDHFRRVEEYVKGEFPEYFNKGVEEPRRAQAVEGSKGSGVVRTSKKTFTFDDLNDDQKRFAKMYEKRKMMTIEQYIENQVKAGYLK